MGHIYSTYMHVDQSSLFPVMGFTIGSEIDFLRGTATDLAPGVSTSEMYKQLVLA